MLYRTRTWPVGEKESKFELCGAEGNLREMHVIIRHVNVKEEFVSLQDKMEVLTC